VPPTTTTTVPVTTTTAAPSTTVPPALPATDGSEVEDQVLQNRRSVDGDVPSAPAAVEMNLVPAYTG
jgi:hypothetical protein